MKMEFKQTHNSIMEFPTIELPKFTVVTGENGTGKTHLLQAIANGSIGCDVANANSGQIRYFEWNNFVPNDGGSFSTESLKTEKDNIKNVLVNIKGQMHPHVEQIRSIARRYGITGTDLANLNGLYNLTLDEYKIKTNKDNDYEKYLTEMQTAGQNISNQFMNHFDANGQPVIREIMSDRRLPLPLIEAEHIERYHKPTWGTTSLFQQSFARLFGIYRDARLKNEFLDFRNKTGKSTEIALTEDEFLKQYGPPPWKVLNEILKKAGLNFYIEGPDETDFVAYTPRLMLQSSGTQINFSNLSSGEKVLISFAFCIYQSNERRQAITFPKLLLFDELDAPLHPSMTRSMLQTIQDVIVDGMDINVILVTHSPSTVALVPEDSIYAMKRGSAGLQKISKSESLDILTFGVPTIAISHDGRRQVFVESPADALNFDLLYRLCKRSGLLASERSLEFISTGSRTESGSDSNTGCDNVIRIVKDLTKFGNNTVFGLLDWDGKNVKDGRIHVLAESRRNGIENLILDPLLIAGLIVQQHPLYRQRISGDEHTTFVKFLGYNVDKLQEIVQEVTCAIFGSRAVQTTEADYCGGFSLNVDIRCHATDDHEYEQLILKSFPALRVHSKRAGALIKHIVETVADEAPHFIPKDLVLSLGALLDAESHSH